MRKDNDDVESGSVSPSGTSSPQESDEIIPGNSSINADGIMLDNQSVFYDFVKKDLINNRVVFEPKYKAIFRKMILGLAAPIGFAGNWLYYKWSWDFVFKNLSKDTPYEVKAFLAVCFIIGNGTTNGILTTKPLMGLLNDLLRPYSKEEKAIYHSEIHNSIRTMYNLSGFVLSVGGQISPAYMVYYQNQILALAILLIASNMGYTWQSFYQMFCDWHVKRKLTPQEQKIEAAKGNFKNYLLGIQNDIIRYQKHKNTGNLIESGDVVTLINALGNREGSAENIQDILTALYNFQPSFTEIDNNLPDPLSTNEERFIYLSSKVLLAFFMMHYWYGGGDAGRTIFGKNSDAAFYFFALFSMACVVYLSDIYMHGSTKGVYTGSKNLILGKEVPDLAKALFPRATFACNVFAITTTLFSWAFGARFVQVAFPEYLKSSSLTIGVVAVIFLLGFSMIYITKPAVFWLMKNLGLATDEELKIITTDEKLDRLANLTSIANHDVFAAFIEKVMAVFPINHSVPERAVRIEEILGETLAVSTYGTMGDPRTDNRFGISKADILGYNRAHSNRIVITYFDKKTSARSREYSNANSSTHSNSASETGSISSINSMDIGSPEKKTLRNKIGRSIRKTPRNSGPCCTLV